MGQVQYLLFKFFTWIQDSWRRHRKWWIIGIITVCVGLNYVDFSPNLEQRCFDEETEGKKWSVCLTDTEGSNSPDLLYYFHGYFESEKSWTQGIGLPNRKSIRKAWEQRGLSPPQIVTFSINNSYFLTPEPLGRLPERNMTLEMFTKKVIPTIESKYFPQFHGRRMMMGVSMGAFNALQVYLYSPELWTRAAILNGFFLTCDPFANFFSRLFCGFTLWPNLIVSTMGSFTLAREHFANREEWAKVHPLLTGAPQATAQYPPLMIQIGTRDEFGFLKGNRKLAALLKKRGVRVTYLENENFWHDKVEGTKVAEFLLSHDLSE